MDGLRGGFGLPTAGVPAVVPKKTVYTQYAISAYDQIVECDATSAAFPVWLPSAAANPGKVIEIVKRDTTTNTITINPSGSDLVGGASSRTLSYTGSLARFVSDSKSNWILASGGSNIVISGSSGNFTTTSAAYVQPTNMSVTLTTSGRPVWLGIVFPGANNGQYYSSVSGTTPTSFGAFFSGSNQISEQQLSVADIGSAASTTSVGGTPPYYFDFPAPGTYVYSFQVKSNSASITTGVVNAKLVAYEMGT